MEGRMSEIKTFTDEEIREIVDRSLIRPYGTDDPVNKPAHYRQGGIECIDAIKASMTDEAFIGYCKGNTQKYLWRLGLKDSALQDAKKAQWYLNKLIETMEAKNV